MPRIWSGSLTFSLVTIPVTLEAATRSHKVAFRQVHTEDGGRVRYRKTCELDERVLEQEDITRAYEAPDGTLVEVTDDELDAMPLPTVKTIEVSGFVELEKVPPEQFDTPYFLAPASPAANKPYVLMRDALAQAGKAAVGKLALHGSERLALVRALDEVLVLQMLHWNDELRADAGAAPQEGVEISEEELRGAMELVASMSGAHVEDYHDDYGAAVESLITARAEGEEPPEAESAAERGGKTVDLMEALSASVDRARTSRASGSSDASGKETRDADVTHLHEHRAKRNAAKKGTGGPAKRTAKKESSSAASDSTGESGGRSRAKKAEPKKTAKKTARSKQKAAGSASRRRTG
ncbi:non-homologous end joining protein Ku [Actinacidiphila yeochonensis]|uniref:non-homologous end joining protein Ku n=1 Tax=Actinacidiphila yeochonensis TaxID=89050 RepID=UPI000561AEAB|nr:Ku protein [Actinacidiphila yeochonensis]